MYRLELLDTCCCCLLVSTRVCQGWDGPICKHMYTYYIYIYTRIMCVYVQYIYIYIHIYIYAFTYRFAYIYIYTCIYIHIHKQIHQYLTAILLLSCQTSHPTRELRHDHGLHRGRFGRDRCKGSRGNGLCGFDKSWDYHSQYKCVYVIYDYVAI